MANPLPPGLPPGFWDDYRKRIESDIAEAKRELAPLETDKIRLQLQGEDGKMRDVTAHWISHFLRTIKNYEAMLDALKKGELR